MNTPNEIEITHLPEDIQSGSSRRSFLKGAALTGATTLATLGGLSTVAAAQQEDFESMKYEHDHLKKSDRDILVAAEIAEALAVTTYSNIIDIAPFFKTIPSDDQGYLIAARQEEMSHYLLEQSVTDQPSPFTSFFYPPKMFSDAQTTLNVLVTLEDAFIAAYLIGSQSASNCGAHHGDRERPSHSSSCCRSRRNSAVWWPARNDNRHPGSRRKYGAP